MLKTCRKCGRSEGEVTFAVEPKCTRKTCQDCRKVARRLGYARDPDRHRGYVRAHMQKNMGKIVAKNRQRMRSRCAAIAVMKSQPCTDCQRTFPPYVMDFDHRNPFTKLGDISSLVRRNFKWDTVLKEIRKCDLVCRNCHALRTHGPKVVSQNAHPRHRANQNRVMAIKVATACGDCGRHFSPCQLDFDHVRGSKYKEVSQLISRSWATIETEIAKCDLVCANCHRKRTKKRLEESQCP